MLKRFLGCVLGSVRNHLKIDVFPFIGNGTD